MSKSLDSLKGLNLLASLISKDSHWKIKILNRWPQIAGRFAKHITIKTIDETSITLEADHPMWAQEMRGNLDELLATIHRISGTTTISKIMVLGAKKHKSLQAADSGKTHLVQRTLFGKPSLELTQAERDALAAVRHKKLATSMAEFYLQCKRRAGTARSACEQGTCDHDTCINPAVYRDQRATKR